MKVYKITICVTTIICILSFYLAFYFQGLNISIHDFYSNLFTGIFSSCLLVLISSILFYLTIKKKILMSLLDCSSILIKDICLFWYVINKFGSDNSEINRRAKKISQDLDKPFEILNDYEPFYKKDAYKTINGFFDVINQLTTNYFGGECIKFEYKVLDTIYNFENYQNYKLIFELLLGLNIYSKNQKENKKIKLSIFENHLKDIL